MESRIAVGTEPEVNWTGHLARVLQPAAEIAHQFGNLVSALLTPIAMMAFVLAAWRLGSDLGWTGEFAISHGFFSHWLVWMAIGFGVRQCSSVLKRDVHDA